MPAGLLAVREDGQEFRGDDQDGVHPTLSTPVLRMTVFRQSLGPLQAGEADRALEEGVRAISTSLAAAASRPRATTRDTLIFVAILVAVLAVLLTPRARGWYADRRRRRRKAAAGTVTSGNVHDPFAAKSLMSRVPRGTSANEMGQPFRTSRSSVRGREPVEA